MKIFIDFDDAIFNTKKFGQDLFSIFGRHGVTRDEYGAAYYNFSKKDPLKKFYDPKMQIRILGRKYNIDTEILKTDFRELMNNLDIYLFPDVKIFLQKFHQKDLFILSYGQPKFQKSKIKGTGIEKFVNRIFITKRKKVDVILELARKCAFSKKEAIILIDDHPDQFELSKKAKERIITFHLSRKEGRYRNLPCLERDYAVRNLGAVERIIKKEKLL